MFGLGYYNWSCDATQRAKILVHRELMYSLDMWGNDILGENE